MACVTGRLDMPDGARLEQQRALPDHHDQLEVLNAAISEKQCQINTLNTLASNKVCTCNK